MKNSAYLILLITIASLLPYLLNVAESRNEHQDYLEADPDSYCELRGAGGDSPAEKETKRPARVDSSDLNPTRQIIVFESVDCTACKRFKSDVVDHWRSELDIIRSTNPELPPGWTLKQKLYVTPTTALFENGYEVARYTGYAGDKISFWRWLGYQILTKKQKSIAYEQSTEPAYSSLHLNEQRTGTFVDPISGAPLFRSDTKYESGNGWPSFFSPVEGGITLHEDYSHGIPRIEVRSASSGIHLGHLFDDGPAPTYKRYCINGAVLKFIPDEV